jgi:hypothetical protein
VSGERSTRSVKTAGENRAMDAPAEHGVARRDETGGGESRGVEIVEVGPQKTVKGGACVLGDVSLAVRPVSWCDRRRQRSRQDDAARGTRPASGQRTRAGCRPTASTFTAISTLSARCSATCRRTTSSTRSCRSSGRFGTPRGCGGELGSHRRDRCTPRGRADHARARRPRQGSRGRPLRRPAQAGKASPSSCSPARTCSSSTS